MITRPATPDAGVTLQLAQIGPFLLLAGNTAAYRDRVATILVSQLRPVIAAGEATGGQIVEAPPPRGHARRSWSPRLNLVRARG
jgi:hypothetical protein